MMETKIPQGKVGYAFCTYVAPGTRELATHDVGELNLALFPHWRVRGYAAAFRIGMITEIVLMGTVDEVKTYKQELVKIGVNQEWITFLITENTTIDNATDMHADLERRGLTPDEWMLLTSDYHLKRAKLTALVRHNVVVLHAFAAESCLKFEAYEQGGKKAMERLLLEIQDDIDSADFLERVLWERNGCELLIADPDAYKSDK